MEISKNRYRKPLCDTKTDFHIETILDHSVKKDSVIFALTVVIFNSNLYHFLFYHSAVLSISESAIISQPSVVKWEAVLNQT